MFLARSQALIEAFSTSTTPRYLVADSKLYTEENAQNLGKLPFITRIPNTLTVAQQVIDQALDFDQWQPMAEGLPVVPPAVRQCYGTANETYRFQRVDLCHYGIAQRWLCIYSEAAFRRAEKTLEKARNKEFQWEESTLLSAFKVQKQLFHLQAQRFDSKEIAVDALELMENAWNYHVVAQSTLHQKTQYAKRGRPTADTPIKARKWQIIAQVVPDWDKIKAQQQRKSCFVLSTNILTPYFAEGLKIVIQNCSRKCGN